MLAAMHGKMACVEKLLEAGADVCPISVVYTSFLSFDSSNMNWETHRCNLEIFQVLMFDTCYGRTCLHYAAYHGHSDCLKAILSVARSSPVAISWLVHVLLSMSNILEFNLIAYDGFDSDLLQGICPVCEY